MNKKYIFLPILLLFGLILASCSSSDNNPVTTNPVGNVYVNSTPAGAQIWYDGINSGKVTPDTILNLTTGNHTFILKLSHYFNDTSIVNVAEGINNPATRTLSLDINLTFYGPIQIWESDDPLATDPSGIVLKTGQATSIAPATYGPVDIFYSSNGYVVATAFGLQGNTGRSTSFYLGSSAILADGVASPLSTTGSWTTQLSYATTNYFFLYDQDHHYSKFVIVDRGGTPGTDAWVKAQWYYNNKVDDPRF